MNVAGFKSRTRWKSMSASASRPSNFRENAAPEPPRARRSITSKPMLCRVPSYLLPGLPRPTTSFLMATAPAPWRPGSLFLLFGACPDQLGLGGGGHLGRGRLGRSGPPHDVRDQQLGVGGHGPPLRPPQVADVDGFVDVEPADLGPQHVGDRARPARHLHAMDQLLQ